MVSAASTILSKNFVSKAKGALNSLVGIQEQFANSKITVPYGGLDAGFSTKNLDRYLNDANVKSDFKNLWLACNGLHLVAKAVSDAAATSG